MVLKEIGIKIELESTNLRDLMMCMAMFGNTENFDKIRKLLMITVDPDKKEKDPFEASKEYFDKNKEVVVKMKKSGASYSGEFNLKR